LLPFLTPKRIRIKGFGTTVNKNDPSRGKKGKELPFLAGITTY
jgi:hypothetical protein